jgi:hypothetical protein
LTDNLERPDRGWCRFLQLIAEVWTKEDRAFTPRALCPKAQGCSYPGYPGNWQPNRPYPIGVSSGDDFRDDGSGRSQPSDGTTLWFESGNFPPGVAVRSSRQPRALGNNAVGVKKPVGGFHPCGNQSNENSELEAPETDWSRDAPATLADFTPRALCPKAQGCSYPGYPGNWQPNQPYPTGVSSGGDFRDDGSGRSQPSDGITLGFESKNNPSRGSRSFLTPTPGFGKQRRRRKEAWRRISSLWQSIQ